MTSFSTSFSSAHNISPLYNHYVKRCLNFSNSYGTSHFNDVLLLLLYKSEIDKLLFTFSNFFMKTEYCLILKSIHRHTISEPDLHCNSNISALWEYLDQRHKVRCIHFSPSVLSYLSTVQRPDYSIRRAFTATMSLPHCLLS